MRKRPRYVVVNPSICRLSSIGTKISDLEWPWTA